MKRSARIVALASVAWLGLAVTALWSGSRAAGVAALAAGIVLLAAVWLLVRAADRERQRWQHTLDALHAGVVLYDPDDRLLLANADFRRLYDLKDTDLAPGTPFEALLRQRVLAGQMPEAAGREQAWIAERVQQHRVSQGATFLRQMAGGRWRRITEQRLPDGSSLGFSIDVTDLIDNQRALDAARHEAERAHQMLRDAVEAMPAAVEVYDRGDRLILFNRRMVDLYPHMADQVVLGETFDALVRRALAQGKVPEAVGREETWLIERLARRGRQAEPLLQRAPDGRWVHIYETPMPDGGLIVVRLDASDIVRQRDDLRAAVAQLEQLSSTDALTGLANRRRFDTRLAEELLRAQRYTTPLALLLIDIDHFKLYNDQHGHPQGDRALQAVAAVLAQQARRPGEVVGRYGGEEFAILLPHAHAAAALTVADRCASAMATLALAHGLSPTAPHVTLSIGAAVHRTAEREDAAGLLRRADAALYAAKAAGRAQCVLAQS
jgi:diguanylate cyclase (GGDEF)-like protein